MSGLSHTHLNTLNSDHFIYGRVLDKLQQSYTPPIYPGWGGGLVSGFLCLLDLICNFKLETNLTVTYINIWSVWILGIGVTANRQWELRSEVGKIKSYILGLCNKLKYV